MVSKENMINDAWGNLSMAEKAEMMKVAVRNGITNLKTIRQKYNEFAEGGNLYDGITEGSQQMRRPVTTGGAGYVPPTININTEKIKDKIRKNLYDNLYTHSYQSLSDAVFGALGIKSSAINRIIEDDNELKNANGAYIDFDNYEGPTDDAIWATYLNIPKNQRRKKSGELKISKYTPSVGKENDTVYYEFPITDPEYIIREGNDLPINGNKVAGMDYYGAINVGDFTIGRGYDSKGEYRSVYDKWDLNPFKGIYRKTGLIGNIGNKLFGKKGDLSFGIGKPVNLYNRIYLDDYYGVSEPTHATYLPEVTVYGNKKSNGGNLYAGAPTDDDLVDWIIREEGFTSKPEDIGDGKMTLGSGLTAKKWHDLYKKRGNKWSAADNRMAVAEEVADRRKWAEKNIPNWSNLPDSSQKALLSYKYNYDFNKVNSPKLFQALADSNLYEAARQMNATSKNPKFKKGLMDRRKREQEWFLKGVETPPVSINSLPDNSKEVPVSTAVINPYIINAPAPEYLRPVMVPNEDSYVKAHVQTPSEKRVNSLLNFLQSIEDYDRMKSEYNVQNTPIYQFNAPYVVRSLGGPIYIKPSHRGRFTALKERTGHSATWFKEHGTPAQRKMATFELNARHWKHGLGGNLFDGISQPSQQMQIGRGYWDSQANQPTLEEELAEYRRQYKKEGSS